MPNLNEVLTEEQKDAVIRVVHSMWEQVAPDAAEFLEGPADAATVVELTLDADRYKMFSGGPPEDIAVVDYVLNELNGFADIPSLLPHSNYEV